MKPELSRSATSWRNLARDYADEYLQPHEVEAELSEVVHPDEISERKKRRAIELGFSAMDVLKSHGGLDDM
jgi:alkylation response protein AidB-like acyl-CoA dehydrogenase